MLPRQINHLKGKKEKRIDKFYSSTGGSLNYRGADYEIFSIPLKPS
jgi:hypothetical protein